jgi:hypothetical protein
MMLQSPEFGALGDDGPFGRPILTGRSRRGRSADRDGYQIEVSLDGFFCLDRIVSEDCTVMALQAWSSLPDW